MKPYYEHGGITIYNADCRDVLPTLCDDVCDMMFTDPPYGVGYGGGHFHSGDVNVKRPRERLLGDESFAIYAEFLPLVRPVVNGPCYIWVSAIHVGDAYSALRSARFDLHALIVWNKTNATYGAMWKQYKPRHELCVYCKRRDSVARWCGPTNECTVWDIPRDPVNALHPTQKPVALAARAIRNHDVDCVLDPFIGAGSTLVAAKLANRCAIGIEIEERYCEIAARRLAQEVFSW